MSGTKAQRAKLQGNGDLWLVTLGGLGYALGLYGMTQNSLGLVLFGIAAVVAALALGVKGLR